jgi:hypothetical protein
MHTFCLVDGATARDMKPERFSVEAEELRKVLHSVAPESRTEQLVELEVQSEICNDLSVKKWQYMTKRASQRCCTVADDDLWEKQSKKDQTGLICHPWNGISHGLF